MEKLLYIDGGFGKNLCATRAVVTCGQMLNETYRVMSGWPAAWMNLEGVKTVIHPMDTKLAYKEQRGIPVLKPDPYLELDFRERRLHLTNAFLRCLGCDDVLEVDSSPLIVLTEEEKRWAKRWLGERSRERGYDRGKVKEIALMPFGTSPQINQARSISWELGAWLKTEIENRGYVVVQFRGPEDCKIPESFAPDLEPRHMLALLGEMAGAVTIDTWLQHACAGLGVRALVLWGATDPKVLGYEKNMNFGRLSECGYPNCSRPLPSLPDPFVCPWSEACRAFTKEELSGALDEYFLMLEGAR